MIATLKSKSFISSIVMAVVMLLVSVFPQFAGLQDELINALTAIAIALVVGHKGKDIAVAFINAFVTPTSVQDELGKLDQTPQA